MSADERRARGARDGRAAGEARASRFDRGAVRPPRRRATEHQHSAAGERLFLGVPARIMKPRLWFIALLFLVVCIGLVMVYSASAVEALNKEHDAAHFLKRQLLFSAVGAVAMLLLAKGVPFDLRALTSRRGTAVWWVIIVALLAVVAVAGHESRGASRWITIGPFMLQPSELAKPALILVAARIMGDFYEREEIGDKKFLFSLILAIGVPLVMIFLQPDLGSTLIIALTICVMAYFCGVSYKLIAVVAVLVAAVGLLSVLLTPWRFSRLTAQSDPWAAPWDEGYQATLAIMAFASGGLFGRGIGNSTFKYSYLPEAHNDFILAIIGEEFGFIGMLLFFAVYLGMLFMASRIAERSPTLQGKIIAYGCMFSLGIQFLINALGILGALPMTGKPMPFISYGGSSVLSSFLLAGLIIRVSVESNTRTAADDARDSLAVIGSAADAVSSHVGRSTAGEPRRRRGVSRDGFSVYDGGGGSARASGAPGRTERPYGGPPRRGAPPVGGYRRIDLHEDPIDRLRNREGRGRTSSRRDRYDR